MKKRLNLILLLFVSIISVSYVLAFSVGDYTQITGKTVDNSEGVLPFKAK